MKRSIYRHKTHGLAASREAADDIFLDWQQDFRVAILHCGIELDGFRGAVDCNLPRKQIGLPAEAAVIGHVGNFIAAKNHVFFLEIAAQILEHRPDIHFLLIGDGPCRSKIESRARAMGFKGNIHFLGTRTDVPTLLRTCIDVFVFPSLLWEGLPLAVVEAQAAGLRCVISNNITGEVVIIPDRVVRLPLTSGAEKWARTTIEAVDRGKLPTQTAVEFMQQTDFTVEHGLSSLIDIYSTSKAQTNVREG